MKTIEQRIVRVIAGLIGVEESAVENATSLTPDLGLDSLDHIEIVMVLEDEFGIEIPDEDAQKWRSVSDIAAYMRLYERA
jgi:acyl carrier protein